MMIESFKKLSGNLKEKWPSEFATFENEEFFSDTDAKGRGYPVCASSTVPLIAVKLCAKADEQSKSSMGNNMNLLK